MLSIVIPALNEEEALPSTLARTLAAAKALRASSGMEVEVLLVDDGSQDGTAQIARSFEGVRVLSHGINRGYGAAIKTGFSAAKGEWLGFLDADGTCDPLSFTGLIKELRRQRAD
ncbi:MAG: glycosyltransferase family 2 protein [Elusimicrobiota bacterium]